MFCCFQTLHLSNETMIVKALLATLVSLLICIALILFMQCVWIKVKAILFKKKNLNSTENNARREQNDAESLGSHQSVVDMPPSYQDIFLEKSKVYTIPIDTEFYLGDDSLPKYEDLENLTSSFIV